MWSTEIEDILVASPNFLGCFPLDELPTFPKRLPASLIVNTDISMGTGDHWLALVMKKDECFYFDSFGLPIIEENLIKYLEPHYCVITYSDVCIQHIGSNKCGEFCISFLKHVNSKFTYDTFLSHFNHFNTKENDDKIEQWMEGDGKKDIKS